jgi:hypothetical protein
MSEPTLRPSDPAPLVVGGLDAAAVAWLLISRFYQDLPPIGWPPVILIGGLALFGAVLAQHLWVRIHQRGPAVVRRAGGREHEPVDPLAVAKFAVLAKASALGGAILTGLFAGFLPWLVIESGRVAGAGAEANPQAKTQEEHVLNDVLVRLEANIGRHLEQLMAAHSRVPEHAQARLDGVIQAAQKRYTEQLDVFGDRREAVKAKLTEQRPPHAGSPGGRP